MKVITTVIFVVAPFLCEAKNSLGHRSEKTWIAWGIFIVIILIVALVKYLDED